MGHRSKHDLKTGPLGWPLVNLIDTFWTGVRVVGPTGDVAEDTKNIQAAIDGISAGVVLLSPGTYTASVSLANGVYLAGSGSSQYDDETINGATVLKRPAGSAQALTINSDSCGVSNMDIDGNGGQLAGVGDCIASQGSNYVLIENVKCIDGHNGFGGDSGTPPGVVNLIRSTFRECNTGVRQLRDSLISECNIVGNKTQGLYLNNGQVRILGNFFEWNRSASETAAPAILLDRNCDEIIIANNQFDRNAGQSVRILSSGLDIPERIIIALNQFKRCGWGTDLTDAQRVSIFCNANCNNLTITGNTWERRNHGPGTPEGVYSPLGAIDYATASQIVEIGNNFGEIADPLDLNREDLTWALSGSGTAEYYLRDTTNTGNDPLIVEPDFIDHAGVSLAAGTAGSLSVVEWDWADNDTLGFSTVYVRLTGDADPTGETMGALWDIPVTDKSAASNIKTEEYRDTVSTSVSATSTVTAVFKTRDRLTGTFSVKPFSILVSGDETSTAANAIALFPFFLRRASAAGTITVVQGTIQNYETGFTVGWNGDATTFELDITASTLGDTITLSLENTGANRLDLQAKLMW